MRRSDMKFEVELTDQRFSALEAMYEKEAENLSTVQLNGLRSRVSSIIRRLDFLMQKAEDEDLRSEIEDILSDAEDLENKIAEKGGEEE